MKKRLVYSPIAREKIHGIRTELCEKYGEDFSRSVVSEIMRSLRRLEEFDQVGVRIAELYDFPTDYYYVFIKHNYFIYRIDGDEVVIVQVFHEKQDFMQKLFGVSGRTQESIDYWGE